MGFGDSFDIPPSGAVFTFGRSRFAGNEPSQFFIRNDPVRHIACGDEHTLLICEGGRAFAFGSNESGQLGLGHNRPVDKPMCLKSVKPWTLHMAACGKSHTLLASLCGKVFVCGANAEGQLGLGDREPRHIPTQIELNLTDGCKIAALAAGCIHSALLTESGEVWTWGGNADGQCGLDSTGDAVLVPTLVTCHSPVIATSLACGYYHTAFTSAEGVWTMGEADNGKLGREVSEGSAVPERVLLPESTSPVQVQAGGSHTIILTDEGQVYGFGSNWCGQLGLDQQETSTAVLVPVPGFIKHISCGESHSAFITDSGEMYTCGDARHGKLGREGDNKVAIMVKDLAAYWIKGVACGGCHTMILAWARDQPDADVVLPPLKPRPILAHVTGESEDLEPESPANDVGDKGDGGGSGGSGGTPDTTSLRTIDQQPHDGTEADDNEQIHIVENGNGVKKMVNKITKGSEETAKAVCEKMESLENNVDKKTPSRVKKMVRVFRRKPKEIDTTNQTSSKACTIL